MNFQQFNIPFTTTSTIQTNGTSHQQNNQTNNNNNNNHKQQFANITTGATVGGAQVVGLVSSDDGGVTYLRPVDTNGFTINMQNNHHQQPQQQIITLPITIPGAKPGDMTQQTLQIQVVNPNGDASQSIPFSLQQFGQVLLYNQQNEGLQLQVQSDDSSNNHMSNNNDTDSSSSPASHNIQNTEELLESKDSLLSDHATQGFPVVVIPNDMLLRTPQDEAEDKKDKYRRGGDVNASVAEYLSRMQNASLPLSLQHFLKFNSNPDTIRRETEVESSPISNEMDLGETQLEISADPNDILLENGEGTGKRKKKYKKKPPKPKKPRPGQVLIATALDGTTLFCCPECNMAYPDKDMLEQHLIAHKIERRFICDICGAGLKRKEHLERHKLGHNPERPFVCSICCKGFKRKEHLNLHFVIHSGEKTEICQECGKGFYRKDHLRKHTRSHIAKRLREEMQQQQQTKRENANNLVLGPNMDLPQQTLVTVTQVGSNEPPTTIVVPVHPHPHSHLSTLQQQTSTSSIEEHQNNATSLQHELMMDDDSNEQKPLINPITNQLILPNNNANQNTHHSIVTNSNNTLLHPNSNNTNNNNISINITHDNNTTDSINVTINNVVNNETSSEQHDGCAVVGSTRLDQHDTCAVTTTDAMSVSNEIDSMLDIENENIQNDKLEHTRQQLEIELKQHQHTTHAHTHTQHNTHAQQHTHQLNAHGQHHNVNVIKQLSVDTGIEVDGVDVKIEQT